MGGFRISKAFSPSPVSVIPSIFRTHLFITHSRCAVLVRVASLNKAGCLISSVYTRWYIHNIMCCLLNVANKCLLVTTCRYLSCNAYNFVCVRVFPFETQGLCHICCIRTTLYATKRHDTRRMVSDSRTEGKPVESLSVYGQFLTCDALLIMSRNFTFVFPCIIV
jgi:hypothetical protein